uniref:Uncharacterized protein n=1 Tax=Sphaerodactylus townsendi TaxID=933632 RepID=A0ACB8FK66_9SAUR
MERFKFLIHRCGCIFGTVLFFKGNELLFAFAPLDISYQHTRLVEPLDFCFMWLQQTDRAAPLQLNRSA